VELEPVLITTVAQASVQFLLLLHQLVAGMVLLVITYQARTAGQVAQAVALVEIQRQVAQVERQRPHLLKATMAAITHPMQVLDQAVVVEQVQ
jgi:hypothetical protein